MFDVDNVLVRGQSQQLFARFLFFRRKLSLLMAAEIFTVLFLYKLGVYHDLDGLRQKAYSAVKGMPVKDFQDLCDDFFERILKNNIIEHSVNLLRCHHRSGDEVVLLSASLFPVVDCLRRELGASLTIATQLEQVNGLYTGRVQGRIPYGPGKTVLLKRYLEGKDIDMASSSVYADHSSDSEMMDLFGKVVAVNPDRQLEALAHKKGWEVMVC